jgi:hypothetical protein
MKKIILIAVLSLVALPVFAFFPGMFGYTRTPSGTGEIINPIIVGVNADVWDFGTEDNLSATFRIRKPPLSIYGNCFKESENPTGFTDTFNLELGKYKYVEMVFYYNDDCTEISESADLELNDVDPDEIIFTIIETPTGGVPSLFSVPMASSSDMLASTGVLFTDLWVIIALVIGIPLAFYIIQRVIALPPKDTGHYTYNKRGEMTGYWKGK